MTTLEKIGKAIKELRVSHGLSQEQFCSQCHIDQHYISNIENGQRNLSVEFLEKIAEFFSISLSDLFLKVDTIDESQTERSCASFMTITTQDNFSKFMEKKKLSERTIKKYSSDVPNSIKVKEIIKSFTGRTNDMYQVTDLADIKKIIEIVANEEFDKVGQRMYSCGLKKYLLFLETESRNPYN